MRKMVTVGSKWEGKASLIPGLLPGSPRIMFFEAGCNSARVCGGGGGH